MKDKIIIKGARQHNLKSIDLELPREKMIVITGLSGSGKSSLAFDTIYAEGQRRYVESLSSYARQFLGQMQKPDVDFIEGLSPAISIDQKTTSHNPRSTVGTVTEIYDYLRLLYARVGHVHCYKCGLPISQQTVEQIVDQILSLPQGARIVILAPLVRGRKGEFKKLLDEIRRDGYVRVRLDGETYALDEVPQIDKNKKHDLEVVVDRIVVRPESARRLADSLETALSLADGMALVNVVEKNEDLVFSQKFACPQCGISIEELSPRMFSFNNPFGACPQCDGLGQKLAVDPELVLAPSLSLAQGAIVPWQDSKSNWFMGIIGGLAEKYKIDLNTPVEKLSQEAIDILLHGTRGEKVGFNYKSTQTGRVGFYEVPFEGIIRNLERRHRETQSDWARSEIERFMTSKPCAACRGLRLRPESLAVTVGDRSIVELTAMSIRDTLSFFENLKFTEREAMIGSRVIREIRERLGFLVNVGLDYLTLDRKANTLSGGEAQRIRLATQIGSSLVGVLYILDEPSIGLHQRDNARLLTTLKKLRDLGNTVLVVEHDEETMLESDYIVDIGPGAGTHGGEVVVAGELEEVKACESSITGQYLSGKKQVPLPTTRRQPNGKSIKILGAREHNLKEIDVQIPLGLFVCITGVSGSGKSTLVNEILYPALARKLHFARSLRPGDHNKIEGIENLDKVINIDQSPIGRTPRSNPATYTGVFDDIRAVFAETQESKMRGYKAGRFSFNLKGGRCEACQGDGIIKIEMHFLPDIYVPCEICKGKRYNRETLEVKYKGKTISDVLQMRVEEALDFFGALPKIERRLRTLYEVGLGYIRLGQSATTLSGGEAQRVKLATELSRRSNGKTLYILDEPTTGLHFEDVAKLLEVLNKLVAAGDTVLVIEHNLDVIKSADYLIDLGPEGGERGGSIVATGTPEEVAENSHSYTGQFLAKLLGGRTEASG
mgnify:FL=1